MKILTALNVLQNSWHCKGLSLADDSEKESFERMSPRSQQRQCSNAAKNIVASQVLRFDSLLCMGAGGQWRS